MRATCKLILKSQYSTIVIEALLGCPTNDPFVHHIYQFGTGRRTQKTEPVPGVQLRQATIYHCHMQLFKLSLSYRRYKCTNYNHGTLQSGGIGRFMQPRRTRYIPYATTDHQLLTHHPTFVQFHTSLEATNGRLRLYTSRYTYILFKLLTTQLQALVLKVAPAKPRSGNTLIYKYLIVQLLSNLFIYRLCFYQLLLKVAYIQPVIE